MDDVVGNITAAKERTALVICDLQPDLLGSLHHQTDRLLLALEIIVEVARTQSWSIVYSGLQFQSGYEGVTPKHKLYGALSKLNAKLGDKAVHWFMKGWNGADILSSNNLIAPRENVDKIIWRSQHVPYELVDELKTQCIDKVYVVGAKASVSVQITCQLLTDQGTEVVIVKECVQDDNAERLQATLDHLLPVYGSVIDIKDFMEDVGIDTFSVQSRQNLMSLLSVDANNGKQMLLASDCERRGHGSRFIKLLMERGGWRIYPNQIWYEDFVKGVFYCPLAKKEVDFCDEPEFSNVAMYLSGREWLDEKDKVIEFAGEYMPTTYCIDNGKWIGEREPPLDDAPGAIDDPCWFIKEVDKNLGHLISIVSKPSEIMQHIRKDERYVIQQHIRKPLLTDDGRKTHLKFYVLLICEDDGVTWTLYTYKGALLSISPQPWSPTDLSHETQVTIHRHPEHPKDTEGWKQHWDTVYDKCKQGTAKIIKKAIASGKLKGRKNKKQFEVFSCDWMPDEDGHVWMFEFNMSPAVAVASKGYDSPSRRGKSRRQYLIEHDENMLRDALAIVMPYDSNDNRESEWDLAGTFVYGNMSVDDDKESPSLKLQRLLDQYCNTDTLPIYPPNRTPADISVDSASKAGPSDDNDLTWTQHDTETALKCVAFDTYLGLKLYHTNPIDEINKACKASGKKFIDHEFNVASEIIIEGEVLTAGIISQQNIEDFRNSGEQMRVERIKHFTDRARHTNSNSSTDGYSTASTSEWTWVRGSEMSGRKVFASPDSICAQNVIQGKVSL